MKSPVAFENNPYLTLSNSTGLEKLAEINILTTIFDK
jgi:hypothetical protein